MKLRLVLGLVPGSYPVLGLVPGSFPWPAGPTSEYPLPQSIRTGRRDLGAALGKGASRGESCVNLCGAYKGAYCAGGGGCSQGPSPFPGPECIDHLL